MPSLMLDRSKAGSHPPQNCLRCSCLLLAKKRDRYAQVGSRNETARPVPGLIALLPDAGVGFRMSAQTLEKSVQTRDLAVLGQRQSDCRPALISDVDATAFHLSSVVF